MTNDNKQQSAKKLKAHVTHLEMNHAPLRSVPVPTRPMTRIYIRSLITRILKSAFYMLMDAPQAFLN